MQKHTRTLTIDDKALAALRLAHPLLVRLGDFIGNGEGPTKMERCDAVLAVVQAIRDAEAQS